METAKETTLSQYQAAHDAELEAAKEEEPEEEIPDLSQEEIDEAVKLLGYDSLADMRTEEHPDIIFRDYSDEYEREKHDGYYELYGYWYPNGDRNSLEYFSISDQVFHWYKFDPEKGDVETDSQRITLISGVGTGWTYYLPDGDSFTVERKNIFGSLSDGTIRFDDGNTDYCDSAEYSYSRY